MESKTLSHKDIQAWVNFQALIQVVLLIVAKNNNQDIQI